MKHGGLGRRGAWFGRAGDLVEKAAQHSVVERVARRSVIAERCAYSALDATERIAAGYRS
jgi:hypothetical protein